MRVAKSFQKVGEVLRNIGKISQETKETFIWKIENIDCHTKIWEDSEIFPRGIPIMEGFWTFSVCNAWQIISEEWRLPSRFNRHQKLNYK